MCGVDTVDVAAISDSEGCARWGVLLKPFTNQELVTAMRRLADTGRQKHAPSPATV
jgi:hypothetical protein